MIDWLYLLLNDDWKLAQTPLRLLHFTQTRMFLAFVTSFAISWWSAPRIIAALFKRRIRDRVRDYDENFCRSKAGTPTMGGLIIILALLASVALWCNPLARPGLSEKVEGPANPIPLLVLTVIFFGGLGALDDWLKVRGGHADAGLSRKLKLGLQMGFAVLFALLVLDPGTSPLTEATRTKLYIPFVPTSWAAPDLGGFAFILIVLAFLGIANAINFADGLDGLAVVPAGLTVLVFGVFAYVFSVEALAKVVGFSTIPGLAEVAVFCGAALGAAIGFLWFNSYPAQVFMGDTGSMTLGGTLAALAILTKTELVFLIAGGIFVYEFLSVFLQDAIGIRRIGRRLFFRAPAHHGFQHRGVPEPKLVIRFWIVSLLLASLGIATLKFR